MYGEIPSLYGKKKTTFIKSILNLMGHLLGSGILFVTFYAIIWGISNLIHWMDGIHKLPTDISLFIARCELWLIYADSFICALVLIVGAWRFVVELGE